MAVFSSWANVTFMKRLFIYLRELTTRKPDVHPEKDILHHRLANPIFHQRCPVFPLSGPPAIGTIFDK